MTLYLDTSSLVKMYVEEEGSAAVAMLAAQASLIAISTVGYAECRAGLARRRRGRAMSPSVHSALVARLDADWSRFQAIDVDEALARRAGHLADRFDLRGFDAIHLASFELLLERADDDDVRFSSADERLARAAKRLG